MTHMNNSPRIIDGTPSGVKGGQGRTDQSVIEDTVGCLVAIAVTTGLCIIAQLLLAVINH